MISAQNDIQFQQDSFQNKPIISKTIFAHLPQEFRHLTFEYFTPLIYKIQLPK